MFKRSENPGLFDEIVNEYNLKCESKGMKPVDFFCTKLEDEQLDIIESLRIDIQHSKKNINNLNGIEKLKNLKKFSMNGITEINMNIYETAKKIQGKIMTKEMWQKRYNKGQLTDISSLYKCKNLRVLSLRDQRNLTELDLSNWDKLECCFCTDMSNLENIYGIDNFGEKKSIKYNFEGCQSLVNVPNLINLTKNNEVSTKVIMPLNSYCFLANKDKQLTTDEEFLNSQNIIWTDGLFETTTYQTKLMKDRVGEILDNILSKDDKDIVKLYKIYKYICEECHYDRDSLQKTEINEEEIGDLFDERVNGELITPELWRQIRSTYRALWGKPVICGGLSNFFGFMCADNGIVAKRTSAQIYSTDEKMPLRKFSTKFNHSISKVEIDGETYLFDPTNDLKEGYDGEYFKFFAVSAREYYKDKSQLSIGDADLFEEQHSINYQNPLNQFWVKEKFADFDRDKYIEFCKDVPYDIRGKYSYDIQHYIEEQLDEKFSL